MLYLLCVRDYRGTRLYVCMPELQHVSSPYDNQFMKKLKKLCYKCNTFRYLRGFKGKGKKRNKVCNLCLFKDSRKMLYMNHEELEAINLPIRAQTRTADELNEELERQGYWFEEDNED